MCVCNCTNKEKIYQTWYISNNIIIFLLILFSNIIFYLFKILKKNPRKSLILGVFNIIKTSAQENCSKGRVNYSDYYAPKLTPLQRCHFGQSCKVQTYFFRVEGLINLKVKKKRMIIKVFFINGKFRHFKTKTRFTFIRWDWDKI